MAAQEQREMELWIGYSDYECHHGALVANAVTTVTFEDNVASVLVENFDATNPIWFTVDGVAPTADGSGDTGNEMIRVRPSGTFGFDKRGVTVRLISAGASEYQVIGLR